MRRGGMVAPRWLKRRCDAVVWAAALVAWTVLLVMVMRRSGSKDTALSVEQAATAPKVLEIAIAPMRVPRDDPTCVCPAIASCDDLELEQRCIEYLANYSNVASIRPMVSNLKVGRTAKLRAIYRDPCVEAVIKMPQSMFPLEPYAEYIAFETDRFMGFGNIPPTSFLFVPIADIEGASAHFANKARNRRGDADKNVTTTPNEYAKWIASDVLGFSMHKGLVVSHPVTGQLVLGCSVQLFLRSARPAWRSFLHVEDAYRQFMRTNDLVTAATEPKAKSGFSTKVALATVSYATQLVYSHNKHVKDGIVRGVRPLPPPDQQKRPNDEGGEAMAQDALSRREIHELNAIVDVVSGMNPRQLSLLPEVLKHMTDTRLFDAIIGNDDRSAQKNNNVYVVDPAMVPARCGLGGARYAKYAEVAASGGQLVDPPATVPTLRPVWLDQGKSLYKEALHDPWLGVPLLPHESQCLFRRSTLSALQGTAGGELYRRLQHVVPPQIIAAVGDKRLMWLSLRAEKLADHAKHCAIALGGEGKTTPWD